MRAVFRLLSRGGEPSRRVRRGAVVLGALGIPITAAVFQLRPRPLEGLPLLIFLAMLVIPLAVVGEFRRNVFRRRNADERERLRRNDAYRISYRILETALPIGFVVGAIVHAVARPFFDAAAGGLLLVVLWYVIFLPYMVFAWREPDAVPD